MSSASDFQAVDSSAGSSDESSRPPTRPASRTTSQPATRPQSHTPLTPRKRRRLESIDPARRRRYFLEGKYNDAYRVLYNEDVNHAATRFETDSVGFQYHSKQIGASVWEVREQAIFFAALERLGRDDVRGIAAAIDSKSIPETQEFLLLLQDAATRQGDAKVTLRDIPAAVEVGSECSEQLDIAGEALAWYQETFEASEERERYGDYWLITTAVAEQIENALNPDSGRATTSPLVSEAETRRRGGRVVVGACTACKKSKLRCDRVTPCGNCMRRRITECAYPSAPAKAQQSEPQSNETPSDGILRAIPQAGLLQPQVMLTLSRTLFMNRSPSIPSPWPHWSEYASEIASEPAIYRSAFNDLHDLVISVTKRLMQTAIAQATSRLRAQRVRIKKGVTPFVKKRDVLAALDIVGMKRDGKERWRTVARRCALRVYNGRWSRYRQSKAQREISWDEAEKLLDMDEPLAKTATTDAKTSDATKGFKSRAARSGTPLPIRELALSDSESEVGSVDSIDSMDSTGADSRAIEKQSLVPSPWPRDRVGRYGTKSEDPEAQPVTIHDFDRKASQQEERALWTLLGRERSVEKTHGPSNDDKSTSVDHEKILTHPDGWRSWTDYHVEWEEFQTFVSSSKFVANQKPLRAPVIPEPNPPGSPTSGSSLDSDSSTAVRKRRTRRKPPEASELQAQGTRAYAAQQGRASELPGSISDGGSSLSDAADVDNNETRSTHGSTAQKRRASNFSRSISDSDSSVPDALRRDNVNSELGPIDREDEPMPSIEVPGRRYPQTFDLDDGPPEMDWNSFIYD